jgi:hypothetical protein
VDSRFESFSNSISEFNVFAAVGHKNAHSLKAEKIFVVEQLGYYGSPPLYFWWCECCGRLEEGTRNEAGFFELSGHPCADQEVL